MKMRVGTFQAPCHSSFAIIPISHSVISPSPSTPNRIHQTNSFPSLKSNNQILQGRVGLSVSAAKKRKSGTNVMEMDDLLNEDGEEGDEEGVYVPFMSMTEWFKNKPSGFGEGKEYDTSVEDKLVEEIEQSRTAQLANINKLKNNPVNPGSKKEVNKAPEVIRNGVCVRVGSLPKKRNIHRDLQLAFKGFPAIVNISPAVSGNKKTRDPTCKGFAFVYLASEEAAKRFVQTFSGKSITFGKNQKQITCEISNPPKTSDSGHANEGTHGSMTVQRLPKVEEDSVIDPTSMNDNSFESWEVDSDDETIGLNDRSISATSEIEEGIGNINLLESDNDNNIIVDKIDPPSLEYYKNTPTVQIPSSGEEKSEAPKLIIPQFAKRLKIKEKAVLVTSKKIEGGVEHISLLESDNDVNTRIITVDKIDLAFPKERKKTLTVTKKSPAKEKSEKAPPKSSIPGSAKRLKNKEKALLAGALSKYGSTSSPALQ